METRAKVKPRKPWALSLQTPKGDSMECPNCKSTNVEGCSWRTLTPGDEQAEKRWAFTHRGGASGHPLTPLTLALHAGTWGAKLALSQVYKCRSCSHKWRKW